jgi:hypothetical protein
MEEEGGQWREKRWTRQDEVRTIKVHYIHV